MNSTYVEYCMISNSQCFESMMRFFEKDGRRFARDQDGFAAAYIVQNFKSTS